MHKRFLVASPLSARKYGVSSGLPIVRAQKRQGRTSTLAAAAAAMETPICSPNASALICEEQTRFFPPTLLQKPTFAHPSVHPFPYSNLRHYLALMIAARKIPAPSTPYRSPSAHLFSSPFSLNEKERLRRKRTCCLATARSRYPTPARRASQHGTRAMERRMRHLQSNHSCTFLLH